MATSNSSVTLADRVAAIRLDRRLDVSGARPAYLAVAGNGAHVRLSPEAFRLLDALRAGVRLEEIAGALNTRPGRRPVTVDELSAAAGRASLGIWLWFVSRLAPALLARATSLHAQFAALADIVAGRGADPWPVVFGLATSLFLLAASAVLIGRLGWALAPASLKSRLASLDRNFL